MIRAGRPSHETMRGWGAACALLAIWLTFCFGALDPGRSFAVMQDNEFLLAPVMSFMSRAILAGDWPLWMPTILGGMPLYNFTQLSALYPFYLLVLPIFDTLIDAVRSIHLVVLGHLFILLCNGYLLQRSLGVTRMASLAGATLLAFNANMLSYATWVNIVAPYAWFPLYLLGLLGVLRDPRSGRHFAVATFAMVMLVLASPAQALIHACLVTVILVVWHLVSISLTQRHWGACIPVVGSLLGLAAASFTISAPVLLPALIDFKDMIRWIGPFEPVMGNARIPFEAFLIDQLSVRDLGETLVKSGRKGILGSPHVGLLPVALAAFAVFTKRRHWVILPLAVLAVYALCSAAGSNLGFAYVNYNIPFVNKIREPTRFLFLVHFSISILAGFGIDRIAARFAGSRDESGLRGILAMGMMILAGTVLVFANWNTVAAKAGFLVPLTLAVLVFLGAICGRYLRKPREVMFAAGASLACCASLWLTVSWDGFPIRGMDYLRLGLPGLDKAFARVAELDPKGDYRLVFGDGVAAGNASMLASFHDVRSLGAYINPAPRKQFEEMYFHGLRKDNYHQALGARFMICIKCVEAETVGYSLADRIGEYSIYTTTALPRLYVATARSGEFSGLGDYAARIATLDLRSFPVLTEKGKWNGATVERAALARDAGCQPLVLFARLNHVRAVIQCGSAGLLVLNEYDSGNWKARVDGVEQRIVKVNGTQVGVPFSAGSHIIEIRYAPAIVFWAWIVSGLAIAICFAAWAIQRRRTRS